MSDENKVRGVRPDEVKFDRRPPHETGIYPRNAAAIIAYVNDQLTREGGPVITDVQKETAQALDCIVVNMEPFGLDLPETVRRAVVEEYVLQGWGQVNFAYVSTKPQLRLFKECKGGPVWLG